MRTRALALGLALLVPAHAGAQDEEGEDERPWSIFAVEVLGGIANYGHFLEQHFDDGQRELRIDLGVAAGATVAVNPVEDTMFRLGYTFSGGGLSFHDDSGTDTEILDVEDLDNLFVHVIGIEALRYLWDQDERLVPYAVAGFTSGIWTLDDSDQAREARVVQPGDSSTLVRFGASAGLGLQLRLSDAVGLRGEWNNLGVGNPFDGKDAFRVVDGVTFSEPEAVRLGRISAGLVWVIGR